MARNKGRRSSSVSRFTAKLAVVTLLCFSVFAAEAGAAPPLNDDFGQARSVRVGTTTTGNIDDASRQRGEPRHARTPAARSVWYRFRASRRLALRVSTCRTNFDSVLAVYSGSSVRTLREVDFNNDGCDYQAAGSVVTITARRGRTYWIAVAGQAARGEFELKVRALAVPRNDDFADALPIRLGHTVSGTTRNATRERGERHYAHTVWFGFRVASPREVRLDACPAGRLRPDESPDIHVYTGRSVDRLVPIAARGKCYVRFTAMPDVTYRVAATAPSLAEGDFRLSARIATPPANDYFANAEPITLGTNVSGTLRDATREPGEPDRIGGGPTYGFPLTVWYRLTLAETTTLRIRILRDAPYPPLLGVYEGDQLNQLTSVEDYPGTWELSHLGFEGVLPADVYSLQFGYDVESDFSFFARAITPPLAPALEAVGQRE